MRGINKILLENILPAHVAEHYLLQVNKKTVFVFTEKNRKNQMPHFVAPFSRSAALVRPAPHALWRRRPRRRAAGGPGAPAAAEEEEEEEGQGRGKW